MFHRVDESAPPDCAGLCASDGPGIALQLSMPVLSRRCIELHARAANTDEASNFDAGLGGNGLSGR